MDESLGKSVQEIAANHRKIIDDWCKAYIAQLYQEGVQIKPGCFTLNEQVPTYHFGKDCMVRKYWFEPETPVFDKEFISVKIGLPQERTEVVCYCPGINGHRPGREWMDSDYCIGEHINGHWKRMDNENIEVSHWMALARAPQ